MIAPVIPPLTQPMQLSTQLALRFLPIHPMKHSTSFFDAAGVADDVAMEGEM